MTYFTPDPRPNLQQCSDAIIEIVKIRRYKQNKNSPPFLGFPISAPDNNIYN